MIGFYNAGDRIKFWGQRGAYWGGLWGLFFGGIFLLVPVVGQVMALGYLATVVVAAVEGAVVVGGMSALGAALFSIGIPKDSIIQYKVGMKTDQFLVTMHGTNEELIRARDSLTDTKPTMLELHRGITEPTPIAAATVS